ncbi:hypothetical protein ACUN9Y_12100 [Halomonas sp. V046]|uniref:hypothetical protein n=1 Tax=Halomonas sp. V046 TaxID=3459611 RepID=UPI004043F826
MAKLSVAKLSVSGLSVAKGEPSLPLVCRFRPGVASLWLALVLAPVGPVVTGDGQVWQSFLAFPDGSMVYH